MKVNIIKWLKLNLMPWTVTIEDFEDKLKQVLSEINKVKFEKIELEKENKQLKSDVRFTSGLNSALKFQSERLVSSVNDKTNEIERLREENGELVLGSEEMMSMVGEAQISLMLEKES